jgi:hypothetical protein
MAILIFTCVTALATLLYGFATLLLWHESKQDRKQREKQFHEELAGRKLNELRSAFYEAWGYWSGHKARSPRSITDALQAGRVFEALIRLECQLGLNGYKDEANNLGLSVITLTGLDRQLAEVGVALGLLPSEYRRDGAAQQAV